MAALLATITIDAQQIIPLNPIKTPPPEGEPDRSPILVPVQYMVADIRP